MIEEGLSNSSHLRVPPSARLGWLGWSESLGSGGCWPIVGAEGGSAARINNMIVLGNSRKMVINVYCMYKVFPPPNDAVIPVFVLKVVLLIAIFSTHDDYLSPSPPEPRAASSAPDPPASPVAGDDGLRRGTPPPRAAGGDRRPRRGPAEKRLLQGATLFVPNLEDSRLTLLNTK